MPPSSSGPADPSDPPRFSSQLHPFFTEALARGAELREQKRREEVRRIASELRAKRTVKVFAWTKSGDPFACSFQNGFVWPYFNLSDDVLEMVGLFNASEERKLELYDAKGFGYWTNVEAGHIIEVREGHSIFLRSKDAEVCRGLKEHLEEFQRSAPHFYGHLAHDRQGVRAFFYDYEMGWDSELTPRERDASATPSGSSSSPSSPASPPSLPDVIEKHPSSCRPSHRHASPDDPAPSPTAEPSTSNTESHTINSKVWPRDFYVSDIVTCFLSTKTYVKRKGAAARTLDVRFGEHFPDIPFKSSTYHDQHSVWRNAPEHLKRQFREAGRTRNGRWSAFTTAVWQYNLKQAKKDVIELSD